MATVGVKGLKCNVNEYKFCYDRPPTAVHTLKVEFLTDHLAPPTTKLPRPTRITNVGTL